MPPESAALSNPSPPPPRQHLAWFTRPATWFWLVLAVAAAFRFYGIHWDNLTSSHPDERHVLMSAYKLRWPDSVAEYLDSARSPLNPRNRETSYFAYGTLPTTVLTAAAQAFNVTKPEDQLVLGRMLSALADLGVVCLVFLLARTLYGRGGGDRGSSVIAVVAAALYAAAVLPIQQAHFFVVDPFGNLFATLTLWLLAQTATRTGERQRTAWALASGVALGLAAACKISLLVLLAPAGAALWLVALLDPAEKSRRFRALLHASARFVGLALACAVTFRLVEPDAFVGWVGLEPRWLDNMRYVTGISRGIIDVPFTLQWVGQTRLVYPWINLSLWGLGPALGIAAWTATLWASWRLLRRREWSHAFPLLWVLTTFLAFGVQWQMTMRYFLPLYAPLALLAAWGAGRLAAFSRHLRAPQIAWLPAAALLALTLGWAVGYESIYRAPFTRVAASRWIYQNVPPGTALGVEHWDDALPLTLPGTTGQESYRLVELPWYEGENDAKRDLVSARLDTAEYLVLASDKLLGSIPRLPWRYPLASEYYRDLFDGRLGFELVAEFRGTMNFFGWKIPTDSAEEAFSVYDHPRVLIFKKTPRYSSENTRALFDKIDLTHVAWTTKPPADFASAPANAQPAAPLVKTERNILLSESRWREQAAAGTWKELFHRDGFVSRHPLLGWGALLGILFAAGFPYAFVVFRALPDRGAGLCRLFTLALPTWALWLAASYERLSFTAAHWWCALGLLLLGAAALGWWQRRELAAFLRAEWPRLLAGELVFWAAFALCLAIRAQNPDLWHPVWGGEKPMEMTYLYGVMKSENFPPMNPWYAGGFINYYYFGFLLCGALIKAVGVLPAIGFNLCLATFYGLTAGATFSVVRALHLPGKSASDAQPSRPALWPAFAGVVFVILLGNLFQGKYLTERFMQLGRADHEMTIPLVSDVVRAAKGWSHVRDGSAPITVYPSDLYWCAARAIPVTQPNEVPPVTEFPFWSFLYADLHPHLISLPFTLALAGVLLAWLRGMRSAECGMRSGAEDTATVASGSPSFRILHSAPRIPLLFAMSFLLGLFWPTNTWDWPTYGALTGLTLFLGFWARGERGTTRGFGFAALKSLALFVPLLVMGKLAFRPFFQHAVSGYGAFEIWRGERTPLSAYVLVHGFFLFILAAAFATGLRDPNATGPVRALQAWTRLLRERLLGGNKALRRALAERFRARPLVALAALLGFCALYLLGIGTLVRGSLPLALLFGLSVAGLLSVENRREPLRAFAFTLVAVGFALSLFVEFVVLAGDVGRMNTVFKFYYQVWVLFAVASAALLPGIWRALPRWSAPARRAWIGGFAALGMLSLLYPVTATPAKIADRFDKDQKPTLDGLAFLQSPAAHCRVLEQDIDLRGDGEAIHWLQDHVAGSPVLLEMNTGDLLYSWGSRFSIHTGLPGVIGWDWHQRQQQAGITGDRVHERIEDVRTLYRTADLVQTRALLEKYGVSLVVVGSLERIYGTPEGLEKFAAAGWPVLYDHDGVTIYQVNVDPPATGKPLAVGP